MFLTRYNRNGFDNPFALMDDMRRELDRLFFSQSPFMMSSPSARSPKGEVTETDSAYVLRMEVPGLRPEGLTVRVEDGALHLAGERKDEAPEGYETRWTERVHYRFDRTYRLPDIVDTARIEAGLKDGLLTVTLPKAEKAAARQIPVNAS